MATFCDGIVQNIERTECIGNSLVKINSNFLGLENAGCDLENLVTTIQTMFVGTISYFPSVTAPTGWLALSGQIVSRAEYSNLWSFANNSGNIVADTSWVSLSAYGAFTTGDLSTTFRIPDLRGHFVRGSGTHTDGTAAGTFGRKQDDDFKSHTHTTPTTNGIAQSPGREVGVQSGTGFDYVDFYGPMPTGAVGGTETRPKNIVLLACIKH
jgi:microcystin-dependent protein